MYSVILHGRRLVHLQKCLNSKLRLNPLQKNVSPFSSPFFSAYATVWTSQDSKKGQSFTVSYLVGSLGFTRKLAESISRKVSFEDTCNADSVLSLLRSHGFNDSQISNIIRVYPKLLILDAEKTIGPKLEFLKSREGASTSELTEIVTTVPKILGMRWEKAISRHYDFAKEIIEADKSPKLPRVNKLRNLQTLRELGVPQRLLLPLITSDNGPVYGKERFEESLKKVVEMGFDPRTLNFVLALTVFYNMSEKSLEERVDVYKRLGFEVGDVWEMFKKYPYSLRHSEEKISQIFETMKECGLVDEDEIRLVVKRFPQCVGVSKKNIVDAVETFLGLGFSRDEFALMVKRGTSMIGTSAETVKKKTEFVVKQMNWPLKGLVSYPQVFGYSMEKRIVPRCNVIKALMSKGLRSELPKMSTVLVCTNEMFLKRFVKKHKDKQLVSELMAIFTREPSKN